MIASRIVLRAALPISAALCVGIALAGWGGDGQEAIPVVIASAVATGILGNAADRWTSEGGKLAGGILERLRPDGSLPPNHDLSRAIRRSQMRALALVASVAADEEVRNFDQADQSSWIARGRLDRFSRQVRRWAGSQARLISRPKFSASPAVEILADHVEILCDEAGVVKAPQWGAAASAMLAELDAAGILDRPAAFDRAVLGATGALTWSTAVHAFLWQEIKLETSVYRVLSLRMLNRIERRPHLA